MKKIIHSPAPWYPIQIAGYMGLFDEDFYSGKRLLDFEEVGPDIAQSNGIIASKAPDMYKTLFNVVKYSNDVKEPYKISPLLILEITNILNSIEELKKHEIT